MYNLPVSLESCIFIRSKHRDAQGETSVQKKKSVRFFFLSVVVAVVATLQPSYCSFSDSVAFYIPNME